MKLLAVMIGQKHTVTIGNRTVKTGIYKTPTDAPVRVTQLGLAGDTIVNTKHHGGVDQAVYCYSQVDYHWWEAQLERKLTPGTFGENLLFDNFGDEPVYIGDTFAVGTCVLQVTAPRIPCATFAARMNDTAWVKTFKAAERPGFYARVVQEGLVQAGDTVTRNTAHTEVSLTEFFRFYYQKRPDAASLQRLLSAPIDIRSRSHYETLLQEMQG